MLTRKAKLLLSLTAATPLLFAACKDNGLLSPYGDVSGTYQLTVFQGRTLPVTYTYAAGQIQALPNGGTIQWTDGTMVLRSDGTFTETNNYIITPSGGPSSSNSFISRGTFTLNGTAFTLSAPAQSNVSARFGTGTLDFGTVSYTEDNGDGTFSSYEYKL